MTVELRSTPDILAALGKERTKQQFLVGFALETENELANARQKLERKNLDLIVLNSTRDAGAAFGSDTNVVTMIDRRGTAAKLPQLPKFDVATEILNKVRSLAGR